MEIALLLIEYFPGGSGKVASTKSNHSCNGEADCTSSRQNCRISTLMGCLDRFTFYPYGVET